MHHAFVALHCSQNYIGITNIALDKLATLVINEVIDALQVSSVRELVKDRDSVITIGKQPTYIV
ncbi:unannotated protein [freshwater metagenome]|uniref:Unannotated protein n=1 Tax=freshwater metagenome TaxID=449393 RepID=A0A6J6UUZ9_9ZZZZ